MFEKKKQVIEVNGKRVELEPKPSMLSGIFSNRKKQAVHISEPKSAATQKKQSMISGMFANRKKPGALGAEQKSLAPHTKTSEIFSMFGNRNKSTVHVTEQKPSAPQQKTSHALFGMFGNRNKSTVHVTEQKQPLHAEPLHIPSFPSTQRQEAKQQAGAPQQQKPVYAAKSEIRSIKKRGTFYLYIESIEGKHKGLEASLRDQGIRQNVHEFIQRMLIASIMLAVVLAVTLSFLFYNVGLPLANSLLFGLVIGVASYYVAFGEFINYPSRRSKVASKNIERDILSAARDMIISLRSGMPLFNAIVSISTGYSDASKEFAKVIERVQLGLPLEDAIDQTASETKSVSFKRMMLQASTSIKAGADVIDALQSVIDQLSQERIIELRRYGQKLNAIAMFYMLFGIILPSMGIAVLVIMTTFIAIFTVTTSVLAFVIIGMIFLQFIFLEMIIGSRPVYSM